MGESSFYLVTGEAMKTAQKENAEISFLFLELTLDACSDENRLGEGLHGDESRRLILNI